MSQWDDEHRDGHPAADFHEEAVSSEGGAGENGAGESEAVHGEDVRGESGADAGGADGNRVDANGADADALGAGTNADAQSGPGNQSALDPNIAFPSAGYRYGTQDSSRVGQPSPTNQTNQPSQAGVSGQPNPGSQPGVPSQGGQQGQPGMPDQPQASQPDYHFGEQPGIGAGPQQGQPGFHPSQHTDQFGQAGYTGGQTYGNAGAGSPSYGSSTYGSPVYGAPTGAPGYGQPPYGQPTHGQPDGAQNNNAPGYNPAQPQYTGQQNYGQPYGGQPMYNQTNHNQPYGGPNLGGPNFGGPNLGGPGFDPYLFFGPRYRPLDADLPPRNSINAFRAIPKVISRLFKRDTANGFAWAFAAKSYGWVIFLTLSALNGIVTFLAMLVVRTEMSIPMSSALLVGGYQFVTALLGNLLIALGVYFTLKWRGVRTSFSDAATIWAAAYTMEILFTILFLAAVVLVVFIAGVAPIVGILFLFVLSIGFLAAMVWVYVIAYQGQRWYSGSPQPFTGKWVVMFIAAILVASLVSQAFGALTGAGQILQDIANYLDATIA